MAKTDEPKLRLAAIIVADVANYTRMMGKHEAATLSRFNTVRHDIVEPAIKLNNGRIFNTTGDGWLAEFPSSVDALLAAIRIQNGSTIFNTGTPEGAQIRFRLGVHQGQVRPDGDNLTGPGIIVAARLEPLCPIGGLAVSHRIREDAAGRLSLDFADQGERDLKGIAAPVRWHKVEPPLPLVSDIDLAEPGPNPTRHRRLWPLALAGGAVVAASVSWLIMLAPHQAMMMARPIATMVGLPRPRPTPTSHEGHLLIAVAHLADDRDHEHEHLLLDRLANDFDGAQTMHVDATITPPDATIAQDALAEAKAQANKLRAEAGADVLLWGTVQTLGGKSAMRLYWTTGEAMAGAKGSGLYQDQTDTIALPALFWDDLKQVIGLLAQSRLADMRKQLTGQYSAAQLAPLIDQVRTLLRNQQGHWSAETDAKVRFAFADALSDYGDQAGMNAALQESVAAYTKVLQTSTRDSAPTDWAAAQNGLGVALRRLGLRSGDAAQIERALAAHKAALEVWTRADYPAEWAETECDLGDGFYALGLPESSSGHLEDAVTAYRAALEERTRDRDPIKWAATENGLANALKALGERGSMKRMMEAVDRYREALKERTRSRVPLDWAATENNLGFALESIAQGETGTARIDEAVTAFRAALQEFTRDRLPLKWAVVMNNLGNALELRGERVSGTAALTEAVGVYTDALAEATRARAPASWVQLQNNMGVALTVLGARTGDRRMVEKAVEAQRNAMLVYTREADPANWGQAQSDLGFALRVLGEGDPDTARLEAAEAAGRAALETLTRGDDPIDWALAQNRLGLTLYALAKRRNDLATMREAVTCLQAAVDAYRRDDDPSALLNAQGDLNVTQAAVQALTK